MFVIKIKEKAKIIAQKIIDQLDIIAER